MKKIHNVTFKYIKGARAFIGECDACRFGFRVPAHGAQSAAFDAAQSMVDWHTKQRNN